MTYEEYSRIPANNWSRIKVLDVSPMQYRHELQNPPEEIGYFRVGRAIHGFILEQDTFKDRFVCYKGGVRRGKEWEAFKAQHAGRTHLNLDEWTRAIGAATALLAHPVASGYLMTGLREQALTWDDEETNLPCKGRVDHCGTHLVDIKSTATIDRRLFAAACARLGYHAQLAFYLDGLRANGVAVHPEPILIAVQSEAPHDVVTYRLPDHVVQAGREKYRRLLRLLRECLETDTWPGIAPEEEVALDLPEWAYNMSDGAVELTMGGVALGGF